MYCVNCGKEIEKNTGICPHCGKSTSVPFVAESKKPKVNKAVKIIVCVLCGFIALMIGFALFSFYMAWDEEQTARKTALISDSILSVEFHETEITNDQMSIIDPTDVTLLVLSDKFNEETAKGTGMKHDDFCSTPNTYVYQIKETLGLNRTPHPNVKNVHLYCTSEKEPKYASIDFAADIHSDFFFSYVHTLEEAFGCTLEWYYNGNFYNSGELTVGTEYFCIVGNTKYIKLEVNEDGTFSAEYQFSDEAPNKSYGEYVKEAVPADFKAMKSGEMNEVNITFTATVTDLIYDDLRGNSTVIETADGAKYEILYIVGYDYVSSHKVGDTVTVYGYFANDIDAETYGGSGNYPVILANILEKA